MTYGALVIGGCSTPPHDTPMRREDRPTPTMTVAPTASMPAPLDTAESSARVVEPPPDRPACAGADVDLDAILASKACRVDEDAQPPWPASDLGLEIGNKSVTVPSGESITLELVIVNRSHDEGALDVENCGGKARRWSTEVVDRAGHRVDYVARCGHGSGCMRDTRRVTLAPGGRAHVAVSFRAVTLTEDGQCKKTEAPMRPGRYTLRVVTPFRDPDPAHGMSAVTERFATAPLEVK
jgi:hypothetical protein